jgi:conjugative relaxase-like TrwC/TraI family protein
VLSIGKLNGSSAAYFTSQVARGAEDYYLGAGETPGLWLGSGADALGLEGEVSEEQLSRLLAGRHPDSGEALVAAQRAAGRKVSAFDLTFSAPKGVSLIAALADRDPAAAARAGHDQAVRAAADYLQRHAAFVRRGRGGTEMVAADGLVGGTFRHRSSRAGDPQLHTHLLVPNLAQGPDGTWSALDARSLYAEARTAGYLYQAVLRARLTERLGLSWAEVVSGAAEPAGFSAVQLRAFSNRSVEIAEHLEASGGRSLAARKTAMITLDDEHDRYQWVTPEEALAKCWPELVNRDLLAAIDRLKRS